MNPALCSGVTTSSFIGGGGGTVSFLAVGAVGVTPNTLSPNLVGLVNAPVAASIAIILGSRMSCPSTAR